MEVFEVALLVTILCVFSVLAASMALARRRDAKTKAKRAAITTTAYADAPPAPQTLSVKSVKDSRVVLGWPSDVVDAATGSLEYVDAVVSYREVGSKGYIQEPVRAGSHRVELQVSPNTEYEAILEVKMVSGDWLPASGAIHFRTEAPRKIE